MSESQNNTVQVAVKNHDGHVVLTIVGRLDSSVTATVSEEIDRLLAGCGVIKQLTLDASDLVYISSSGLRILLGLAKRYPDFHITEASPEVYEIFDVTGFNKIMNIDRALHRVSIDGCEVIGRGGVGTVYRVSDDKIIKVFPESATLAEVRKEINLSKDSFVLGVPTAISYDVVKVGTQYGLVYELLKADTLTDCIIKHPEHLDDYARKYAELFRQLHSIEVPQTSPIPSAIEHEKNAIQYISRYFDTSSIDLILHIANSIPAARRLLHGDLQTKNAMMENGRLMLIDMGEVGYGHPLLDMGHTYSAMISFVGDYERVLGFSRETGRQVFDRMLSYYFQGASADEIAHRQAQMEAAACVRSVTWLSLGDHFPDALIRECQERFAERVMKRKDHLLEVCKTFSDWEL